MVLGIDDTDSASLGMCTTFVATAIIERLVEGDLDVGFGDYPHLVRLNPQVPNKTRGNGAVALSIFASPDNAEEIMEIARDTVAEHAALGDESTHPGIALLCGRGPSANLEAFHRKCLHRIVSKGEALAVAKSEGIRTAGMKKGLGIIGAIASLGANFSLDQTFEIIAYRDPADHSRLRDIDEGLVLKMDREVKDTFYNYDYANGKVCVAPASPCPVFFGVRGETPDSVLSGFRILRGERAQTAVIFRTNQHTDAHIEDPATIVSIRERSSVAVEGTVSRAPRDIVGGHVIFGIGDDSGRIDCAAYEPTKQFRRVARQLMVGDRIRVYGSARPASQTHGPTINLEKIQLIAPVASKKTSPACPRCGSRLTSMGRNAGFKCRRKGCGFRDARAERIELPIERGIDPGFYEPPPVAWRHLYKPLLRGVG